MKKLSGSLCKMLLLFSFILVYSGCSKNNDTKITVPFSPSTLVATSLSESQISLSWQDNAANETGFKINRKTDSTSFTLIATLSADKVLFVDTNLQANTTYHYQVYAYNSAGNSTPFSNIASAKTLNKKVAPVLSTTKVDSILFDRALSGGSIMSDGNSPILERGVVWDISPNPTINLTTKTVEGSGSGVFKSYVNNLAANTTYYLRAYATNNIGTAYGNQEIFTTKSLVIMPTFADTIDVTPDIDFATVFVFGLKSVGTGPIISRGVVWSTSPGPTIDLPTKISNGSITGSYWTELNNLTSRTKYYIREYATNATGTVYSRESSFITVPDINTVEVGDDFQGGVVFYILQPSDVGYSSTQKHGLIASKNENSAGFSWNKNNSTILVGGTDSIIGSGNANTIKIVSAYGNGSSYAAKHCSDKIENSYADWYLPSKFELNVMYNNIGKGAPAPFTNIGGFQNLPYWSSTELNDVNAYFQHFGTGSAGSTIAKTNVYLVRAIRKF